MSKIVLDAATAEALRAAVLGAELVGPDGQPVGQFVSPYQAPLWQQAQDEERRQAIQEADAEVTLEELEAADAAGGEIPMAEVFKLVEKYRG